MKNKIVGILVMTLLITTALTFFGIEHANAEFPLNEDCIVEGYGTYFEITNSSYLNINLTSSQNVYIIMSSIPYSVSFYIESNCSANSTEITLSGFEAYKTYYMYEDGNLTSNFTTDEYGSYTYIQDLTTSHHVFTQEKTNDELKSYVCIDAFGTYFEITNSKYLNITLTSSENVHVILSSKPYSIDYYIDSNCSANSTEITLSGFEAYKTYYVNENGYLTSNFTTDEYGSYTYIQDLITSHYIVISEYESTVYIFPDGSIYPTTAPIIRDGNTYTLTNDIYDTILIQKSIIIFDGNGYTIHEPSSSLGWAVRGWYLTDVTIKNLKIEGFIWGIYLGQTAKITINNCSIKSCPGSLWGVGPGIECFWNSDVTITNCTISRPSFSGGNPAYGMNIGYPFGYHPWAPLHCAKIINCTISNCSTGICLYALDDVLVKDNTIIDGLGRNILIDDCIYGNITNNLIKSKEIYQGSGIHLTNEYKQILPSHSTVNINVWNNTIRDCYNGIGVYQQDNVNIIDNTIYRNIMGVHVWWGSRYNYIAENYIINGYHGVHIVRYTVYNTVYQNDITNFYRGIHIFDWDWGSNNISQNNISNCWEYGIYCGTPGNTFYQNNISNNQNGIFLFHTYNNKIEENLISDNTGFGIRLYRSNYHNIFNNTIENNGGTGIWLSGYWVMDWYSVNNLIYHNCIINNAVQAYDDKPYWNKWHHPGLLEGNYWSDYLGYDDGSGTAKHAIAGDGIGDTDIAHPTTHYDFYPFDVCGRWRNRAPVADAGGPYDSALEGSAVVFDASGSSDPDGDILQYRWDFDNDGTWDTSYSTDPTASYTWNDDYTGTVTLEVYDGSLTDTATTTVTVNNVAPTADAGLDHVGDEPSTFTFTGNHTDPGTNDTHTYEWDFDYDGVTFDIDATGNNISHTWEDYFDGTVALRVTDDDGGWHIDTCNVTVNNVAPTADAGADKTGDEPSTFTFTGSHTDPGPLDTHTYEWDFDYDGVTFDVDATGDNISHTWEDDFDGTVALRVTDDDGGWHIDTCNVTVNNVAPTITSLDLPIVPLQIGTAADLTATFTDPGLLDTHNATIDWDDGNVSSGTISGTGGSYDVSSSWSYGQPGVYTITLTVEDDDGGSDTNIFQYVVVYDPSAGFVTGGGWIMSPEGAYTPDPTLSGKANFGFVSKYKKGQQTPSGNTEFNFKVADMNFHSKDYDWLVIANAKAMYKGTGKINGEGNYGFMLSAIDEELTPNTDIDLFRIKIWDKDNNDIVIYDNQLGDDDNADPIMEIGSGQIKIHEG